MNHLEYPGNIALGARHANLSSPLLHLPAAAYQHPDARAVDRIQPGQIDYQLARPSIHEGSNRTLRGLQQIAQLQAAGDPEDRDIRLDAVSFGFGDHDESDCTLTGRKIWRSDCMFSSGYCIFAIERRYDFDFGHAGRKYSQTCPGSLIDLENQEPPLPIECLGGSAIRFPDIPSTA